MPRSWAIACLREKAAQFRLIAKQRDEMAQRIVSERLLQIAADLDDKADELERS
jgi:hypothetical protein